MRYLLDTNVVSEPLRPTPNLSVVRRLSEIDDEAAIGAPVWHELRFGCARLPPSRRRESLEHYIDTVILPNFPVLEYDREAADWHARERARLRALGRTPPFIDGQVAAIAYVNDLVLATTNVRDFRAFQGLHVESWA